MEIWTLFLILAVSCFVVGTIVAMRQPSANSDAELIPADFDSEGASMTEIPLPTEWNEALITQQFTQIRDQRPSLIPHFFNSVVERFILGQAEGTAQRRTEFFRALIEQLKLRKELEQAMDDLRLHVKEREKRAKALELDHLKLDIEMRRLSGTEKLEAIRDEKKIELEIAQIEKQMADLKNPSKQEPIKTPQQERAEKRSFWEKEVSRLMEAKRTSVEAIPASEQESRVRTANMYDNAIENSRQQLSRYL